MTTPARDAWESVKAADLAVRDGNIPLIILLLTLNAPGELRRIPATAWHRLQMLAQKSAVTLLVFTPHAQIGCARLRLSVSGVFPLGKLHDCRRELLPALEVQVARHRIGLGNASMPGRVVVQWDKDDCQDLGIIKVDLLGLGMMAVLQDAMEMTH